MIKIYLSKTEYEYDIRALVKAFYPEHTLKVTLLPNEQVREEVPEKIAPGIILNNKRDTNSGGLEKDDFEIYIEYEPQSIRIKAAKLEQVLYEDLVDINTSEKKQYRNKLKKTIYKLLKHLTKKELPWGTLTGVRPTKIALEKLEEHIEKNQIEVYLKEEYYCSKEKINLSLQVAQREHTLLQEADYKNGYSVYIGIPFCPSTCLYCSFTSYSSEKFGDMMENYLQALFREITFSKHCFQKKKLSTIYLGGGTPTTLSASQLDRLLTHISSNLNLSQIKEYTVEAGRPDSITLDKLKVLKSHGVTRISINPQSMSQKTLDIIGRKHTVEQVVEAFHMARDCGHDNINMDMIIGLPGEVEKDVAFTLSEIDKLKPDSLTVHTLAIKRAARLNIEKDMYQGMVSGDVLKMLQLTWDYTKRAGYDPYYLYRQKNMAENLENVGYAKHKKEGLYNILIMEEKQSILALGAGALSKFVFHGDNRIERVENVKSLKDYIERIGEMIDRKHRFLLENEPFL